MKNTMIALSMAALFGATSANALDFDPSNLYYGAGFGQADVDAPGADTESAFQIFAGMPLDIDLGEVQSAVEVGYRKIDTTPSSDGLFIDYVASFPVADQVKVQGIIGLDFNGDMDMLEYGIGGEYQVNDQFSARASYMFKETDQGGIDVTVLGIGVTFKQ